MTLTAVPRPRRFLLTGSLPLTPLPHCSPHLSGSSRQRRGHLPWVAHGAQMPKIFIRGSEWPNLLHFDVVDQNLLDSGVTRAKPFAFERHTIKIFCIFTSSIKIFCIQPSEMQNPLDSIGPRRQHPRSSPHLASPSASTDPSVLIGRSIAGLGSASSRED